MKFRDASGFRSGRAAMDHRFALDTMDDKHIEFAVAILTPWRRDCLVL